MRAASVILTQCFGISVSQIPGNVVIVGKGPFLKGIVLLSIVAGKLI